MSAAAVAPVVAATNGIARSLRVQTSTYGVYCKGSLPICDVFISTAIGVVDGCIEHLITELPEHDSCRVSAITVTHTFLDEM